MPGFPFAHFLAATVLVARQLFDPAERDIVAGIAGHEVQMLGGGRFSGKALHWLHGLLLAARGDGAGALASLERELSFEGDGHIYARESAAHAWHAIGALRLRGGDTAGAAHAFEMALERVPSHPLAHAGLAIARWREGVRTSDLIALSPAAHGSATDVAMARAALVLESGDVSQAAAIVVHALEHEASDSAGWILPIEPLLNVVTTPTAWAVPLARLRARAM